MKKILLLPTLILILTLLSNQTFAQEKKTYKIMTIAFYNVENLFDTIIDPDPNKILQDDFTPKGPHRWNTQKYNEKMQHASKV